eukprot:CAMPEP_0172198478 /NCGR_PEP_ID=MMETSP1050-20130122/28112_1 /TAXON_ID=233186 /ORGANISM="Cryptomonas curvata, Strain CCAP979/52" /LENGTH=154 /DNA_ID=CAMNT_0012875309 /DNA_START=195 /DNA_END=655 /DNA_ORIENTATION=+
MDDDKKKMRQERHRVLEQKRRGLTQSLINKIQDELALRTGKAVAPQAENSASSNLTLNTSLANIVEQVKQIARDQQRTRKKEGSGGGSGGGGSGGSKALQVRSKAEAGGRLGGRNHHPRPDGVPELVGGDRVHRDRRHDTGGQPGLRRPPRNTG